MSSKKSKAGNETEDMFNFAVEQIKNSSAPGSQSKGPTDDEKLKFYGLYKQATIGDCNIPQPWAIQVVERAKWEAWNSRKGMTKDTAMTKYCELHITTSAKYNK